MVCTFTKGVYVSSAQRFSTVHASFRPSVNVVTAREVSTQSEKYLKHDSGFMFNKFLYAIMNLVSRHDESLLDDSETIRFIDRSLSQPMKPLLNHDIHHINHIKPL